MYFNKENDFRNEETNARVVVILFISPLQIILGS
jgi:hypothetical protein